MSRRAALAAIALAAIVAAVIRLADRTPTPRPASAPATDFSAERALVHVREIARSPRPVGSAEHARVRAYLAGALMSLGLETQIQSTTGVGTIYPVAGRAQNVVARLPGRSRSGHAVLLVAHYDGVPAGPAAGDDAAGVAALLESLRALAAGPPLAHDVIVLFTDSEESGLTGAAAFVREHAWASHVAVVLNFEARGTGGPSLMFQTGAGNLDVVRELRRTPYAAGTSLAVTVYRLLPNDTDLSELLALDRPALNFSFIDGLGRYHSPADDIEHLSPGTLQHHGGHALALARAFGDGQLPRPRTGDAVFFTIPGVGLVAYDEWFAVPIAIGAALLAIVAILRARRGEPRAAAGVALGAAATIVATVLCALLGVAAGPAIDAALGRSPYTGSHLPPGLYAIAIAVAAAAIASASWTLVRRWTSLDRAQAGSLAVWAAAAVATAWKLPGASFLFVWPLAAATIAALARDRVPARVTGAIDWIAAIAVAAIVAPIAYTIGVVVFAMNGTGTPVIAVFVALSLWLTAPALDAVSSGRRWRAPIVLMLIAMAILAIAVAVRARAGRLQPSTTMYLVDAGGTGAWLVATGAPGRRDSSGAAPEWLERAIGRDMLALAAPAPPIALDPPDVTVSSDAVRGDRRHLELRVTAASGTHSLRLRAIAGDVLSADVDGRSIDTRRYRSPAARWTLGYVAPPPEGFTLTLTLRSGDPLDLEVLARSPDLPAAIRASVAPRPPGVVPVHAGDQTIVNRRFRF